MLRHRFDAPARADLTLQRFPIKRQRRLRRAVKLVRLHAAEVGIEHEAALIEAFEQHHAHIGQAVGIDGRHRHGVGIDRLGALGFGEPGGEQAHGLVGLGEVTAR